MLRVTISPARTDQPHDNPGSYRRGQLLLGLCCHKNSKVVQQRHALAGRGLARRRPDRAEWSRMREVGAQHTGTVAVNVAVVWSLKYEIVLCWGYRSLAQTP